MGKLRVRTMVVDDSPQVLTAICEYLKDLPEIDLVATAQDGKQAVEKFESLKPDLVLMDFQIPKLNGFQALGQIKSWKSSTKVVIFTVHDSLTLRKALLSKGADGFLSKSHFYRVFPKELERLFPAFFSQSC